MKQDIDTVSLIPRYELGARYALDDRVFRYARAGNTLHGKFGVKSFLFQHVFQAALAATSLIGAKTVTITVANTDGMLVATGYSSGGAIAEDELADGYVCFHLRDGAPRQRVINRKILRNTAVAAPGGPMTLTIDKPLSYDLIAGGIMYVDCMASQYRNVQYLPMDSPYASVVGVPTMSAFVNEYLWLQTWGPYVANADLDIGVQQNGRGVFFGPDGNLHPGAFFGAAADPFNTYQAQYAGYLICNRNDGPRSRGAPFIFLQITP